MSMGEAHFLDGKVIAVTGAGRGIGRAVAIHCARMGASVVVNDCAVTSFGEQQSDQPAQEVALEIRASGGQAVANVANVADYEAAETIVQDAISNFGRIDCVVNNAGILRDNYFHKLSLEDWNAVVDVHLNGSFNVARAASVIFKEQRRGCFVHFTSTSGLIGDYGRANYAAAKMGIVGLSKGIALDLAHCNVRSNCVAPFAWTRMVEASKVRSEEEQRIVDRLRVMRPEKVAPLVAFLCSDAASKISGQIIGIRKNEIYLFSQPRPSLTLYSEAGWTQKNLSNLFSQSVTAVAYPLETSNDVFSWDVGGDE